MDSPAAVPRGHVSAAVAASRSLCRMRRSRWSQAQAAQGNMEVLPNVAATVSQDTPPIAHELQSALEHVLPLISFPERVLLSPLAYLAYRSLCENGSLRLAEFREEWCLSVEHVV